MHFTRLVVTGDVGRAVNDVALPFASILLTLPAARSKKDREREGDDAKRSPKPALDITTTRPLRITSITRFRVNEAGRPRRQTLTRYRDRVADQRLIVDRIDDPTATILRI